MVAYTVDSHPDHLEPVANNLRAADKAEIWASGKLRPLNALSTSFILSRYCKTIMIDDKPVGMFGVTPGPALTRKGAAWMLGTPEIETISKSFLRGCRVHVPEMLKGYTQLYNHVDARNIVAIGWLRWLGFDILEAEPYGHLKIPFHKFVMENPDV